MDTVLRIRDQAGTIRLGEAIARAIVPGDAVLLSGVLGAGKTTLARALIRASAGDPALEVPSPTYTLLQEYDAGGVRLAHLDLWRLEGPEALDELGWDELRAGIVLVEWPDRLGARRPAGALAVGLDVSPASAGADEARLARLDGWPAARLAPLLAGRDAEIPRA